MCIKDYSWALYTYKSHDKYNVWFTRSVIQDTQHYLQFHFYVSIKNINIHALSSSPTTSWNIIKRIVQLGYQCITNPGSSILLKDLQPEE